MVTHTIGSKAVSSVAGAGLLASIAQDPNFWVLFATAIIVSSMSFIYDLKDADNNLVTAGSVTGWFKYIFGGLAVMFVTFYGLVEWVPDVNQLPDSVWYMVAMVSAGYSTNIIRWLAETFPSILPKLFGRW